jgi:flagellar hook assembly protein FlgD
VAGSGAFPYGSGRAALLARDIEASFSNYPNPFVAGAEKTTITFYLPVEGLASLRVFTVTGEPVRTILDGTQLKAGLHQEFSWDGMNGAGNAVLNGVYYLVLKVDSGGREHTLKRKVALVR